MSVYWWPNHTTGKLLFRNGILAKGPACCCVCCTLIPRSGRTWKMIAQSADCAELDGIESPLQMYTINCPEGTNWLFDADPETDCGGAGNFHSSICLKCEEIATTYCWEKYKGWVSMGVADCGVFSSDWEIPIDGDDGDDIDQPFWVKFGPLPWYMNPDVYDCGGCCEEGDIVYVVVTEVIP